jgi:multiple sugar transport system substrate-binding protein
VNSFASENGLQGRPQSIPEQYETKLNTLLAGNNAPDAGYLTQGMAMRLGEQGKIVNVLDVGGMDALMPSTLHYYADGKAVSQTCIEAFGLWYNQDVTDEAGVTPPATSESAWVWDDYIAAADSLTVDSSGRHPSDSGFDASNVARYGTAAPGNLLALVALLKSRGVDLFNADGTATNIDSPEAIDVLQSLQDLIFEHRVAPTAVEAQNSGGSSALLGSGRIAMAIDGQWLLPDVAATEGLNYNVGVLPKFNDPYTLTVSGANGVFTKSRHKELALELLLALADPKSEVRITLRRP